MLADFGQQRVVSGRERLSAAIVPHAGWVFSGSIAHNALVELAVRSGRVDTVVLFAGHLSPSSSQTAMVHGSCETPFGELATDVELVEAVCTSGVQLVGETPQRHTQDNSAEVLFPLIRRHFPDARLAIFGAAPREDALALADSVSDAVERLGRRAVYIGSTDLSHYGPNFAWMPQGVGPEALRWVRSVNDPLFIDAACAMEEAALIEIGLAHRNACCPGSAAAAIRCAHGRGAREGVRLRYGTSADVHPDASFVGYAAVVF